MKDVFFSADVLRAEKEIIDSLKIPSGVLMENAGLNFTQLLLEKFGGNLSKPVTILTGKGNNAGDGFVIARHLITNGKKIYVVLLYPAEVLKGDALTNFTVLKNVNSKNAVFYEYESINDLKEIIQPESIVIDAVFGIGFKGELESRIAEAFKAINKLKNIVTISVDIPSGLCHYYNCEGAFNAGYTISMGVKKFDTIFYNGREAAGRVSVIDIGVPVEEFTKRNEKQIFEVEAGDIMKLDYRRKEVSHKYSNGKLLVLGGSKGLSGAPYLSSGAALRTGSGVVVLGYPESLNEIMETKMTETIKMALPETGEQSISLSAYDKIKERLEWADAVLIGPGISKNEDTLGLVRKILAENSCRFVLDAEATYSLKDNLDVLKRCKGKVIITPHIAEFSRMVNVELEELKKDFYTIAKSFAAEYNVILVLKNAPSIITDGKSLFINSTGKENLATAGTGDVLSGIIASLFSLRDNSLNAALAGAYMHGMCGDICFDETGSSSTLASDLIDKIPEVKNMLFEC
jgi:NAD(P)H-hydrate epimerase